MLSHKRLVPVSMAYALGDDRVVQSMQKAELQVLEKANVSWYDIQFTANPSDQGGLWCYDNIRKWEMQDKHLVLECLFSSNAYHVFPNGNLVTKQKVSEKMFGLKHYNITSQELPGCVPCNYLPVSENFVFVGDRFRTCL
jgi:hypothetical protein